MGNILTAFSGLFNFTSEKKLLMLGLDCAGKFEITLENLRNNSVKGNQRSSIN